MSKTPSRPARPTPPPAPALTPESAPPDVVRLSLTLKPDGSALDWERMRDTTKNKLIDLVRHDARFQPSTDTSAIPEIFSAQWCDIIYSALGQLEATLIARVYKVTAEQAAVMIYTDHEKAVLTGPTQKILNKYASSWLASYTDEAALLITLGQIHISKLTELRAMVERAQRPPANIHRVNNNPGVVVGEHEEGGDQ